MDSPEKREKFGYKKITNDGKVVDFIRKAKRRTEMRRVVRYLLTHTGYFVEDPGKMESYRWVGTCSKKAFKVTKEELEGCFKRKRKMKPCLRCNGPLAGLWYVFSTRSFDIKEGLDPPKYWDELWDAAHGYDSRDAGLFMVHYEKMELNE